MIRVEWVLSNGRGVVATENIGSGVVLETAPLIITPKEPSGVFYFPWDETYYAIALGKISLCNHSYTPNCHWIMDDRDPCPCVKLVSIQPLSKGEELTIPYNCKLWFEAK